MARTLTGPSDYETDEVASLSNRALVQQYASIEDLPTSPIPSKVDNRRTNSRTVRKSNVDREEPDKYKWPSPLKSILSFCSYSCAPGGLFMLPLLCAKHKGAAFVYCYLLSYLFVGLPAVYLEMALGQYTSTSPRRIYFRIAPVVSGISLAMMFIISLRTICLAANLSYVLYLLAISVVENGNLPWRSCPPAEKGKSCYDCHNTNCTNPGAEPIMNQSLPYSIFLSENIHKPLFRLVDFDDASAPAGLLLSLFLVWTISALISYFEIRHNEPYPFVTLPLFFNIVFLLQGFLLEGWVSSARFLLVPGPGTFSESSLYGDAIAAVLISLHLGDGGISTLASHNSFHNSLMRDAVIVVIFNAAFSITIMFGSFFHIGHFAARLFRGTLDERVAKALHIGLFELYGMPETFSGGENHLSGTFQCIFYFSAIILLLLQNLVLSMNVILESAQEKWIAMLRSRWVKIVAMSVCALSGFACSYFFIIPHGFLTIHILERYISLAIPLIIFAEMTAVNQVYGLKRFIINVDTMVGSKAITKIYWWLSWILFAPVLILLSFLIQAINWPRTAINRYWPERYVDIYGWMLTLLIAAFIPGIALLRICRASSQNEPLSSLVQPTLHWGPATSNDRIISRRSERAMRVP